MHLVYPMACLQTDPKTGKKGPSMPPHPINDPLVMAAKGGHMEVVKQLATFYTLCAGCAAAEAARKGHAEITKLLATGPAVAMMQVRPLKRWALSGRVWQQPGMLLAGVACHAMQLCGACLPDIHRLLMTGTKG